MTDGEFLTQTVIERMDLIFRRSNKEPSEEEKAERQERESQFRRILDSLPEDDRELLKEMQTEAFRRAAPAFCRRTAAGYGKRIKTKLRKNRTAIAVRFYYVGAVRGIRTLATFNSTTPLAGAPLEPLGYHRMSI